ncbi:dodecin [Rhizorhapis sp.]|uniref:dodecin n=1 Tax=Rhizorhapis sp. TaxID=1968842 RepID=UPI002B49338D|nr:dodecin [Rhizorhapis sp.]HKR17362.1 dodecin [Rhizorhapis sp.]
MQEHIFKVTEIVGTSSESIDDAVRRAMERASRSLRNLGWFEIVKTTGHVKEGRVEQFQVTLKVGFTLEE